MITDEDIKTAYNRSKSSYLKKPEEAKVQHILFKFTEENKTDMRAKAQEVYNEVKAQPEKFAQLAAEKSASSDKGSTITVKRSDKKSAFSGIAFGLKKDEISPVRETAQGFEIIKLVEKIQPEYKSLDEVKGDVAAKLKNEKFERLFSSNAQRVVSQESQAPGFLAKFIEQHKGQLSTVKDITLSDSLQNKRIFKTRKIGDYGFYEEAGKGYIIELTEIVPSKVPTLADIKQTVIDDIYKKKAEELLTKDLKQGLDEIRSGNRTLAQVAESLKSTVDITDWVNFSEKESLKKLEDMKLSLPEIAQLTKQGAITSEVTDTHGYLIQVKQLDDFKPEDFEKEKVRIRTALTSQENQGLTAGFVQMLKDKAKISLNEQILKQIRR
jgi:parvulin-like peptidyl-prolyl isomerase